MKTKLTYWLQIKVFIGLGATVLGAALFVFYLEYISRENHASLQLLSQVKQLETQGKAIQRRGITYAAHAPRDYAPYERDVIIFYPDFKRDLDAFERQIQLIEEEVRTRQPVMFSSSSKATLVSIENLQQRWAVFRKGFQDKLGYSATEPRLEWGAEYVQENQASINAITGDLIMTIETAIQAQLEENQRLTRFAMIGAALLLLLGVLWFYLSVIRRIRVTVKACQRVAQGDFGYQLPAEHKDELGVLATAFNTLSARTRLVVTMLTSMHLKGSTESKIDALWNQASGYLPMQWLGLFEMNAADNRLSLDAMRTRRKLSDSIRNSLARVTGEDQHLAALTKTRAPLKYDHLANVATSIPNAKVTREILKLGLVNSALIVPLAADNGWKGLLVFVAQDEAAYTTEQVELMANLAPFIANGFAQAQPDVLPATRQAALV
ncbi:MAG: HAMP domain-containing protein [Gammaproteobacteria bacterium]|nr:HAMP domain-containing protein [Gammaproteobacteria bacterium]